MDHKILKKESSRLSKDAWGAITLIAAIIGTAVGIGSFFYPTKNAIVTFNAEVLPLFWIIASPIALILLAAVGLVLYNSEKITLKYGSWFKKTSISVFWISIATLFILPFLLGVAGFNPSLRCFVPVLSLLVFVFAFWKQVDLEEPYYYGRPDGGCLT